jgi:hypothetical protein
MEHNKIGRERQKIQYNKNTKLVTFSEGEYVYLKEMSVGVGKSKKFRDRWRGPFLITKRLLDWNYQIQLKPGKTVVVNVNRMKRCHNPPTKKTRSNRDTAGSKCVPTGNDQNNSETEMTDIVIRSQQIPCLDRENQDESLGDDTMTADETGIFDDTTRDPTWRPGQTIQNRTPDGNDQDTPHDSPRYNLRSGGRLDSQPQASGEQPQAIVTPEEPINQPQDVLARDHDPDAESGDHPPFPYSLRPLPGRRNF